MTTTAIYGIDDTSHILSPGLVVFRDLVEQNLDEMLRIAGDVRRLRPHCKTHKMREVVQLQLARGITKHKCATLAEAEMLATAGVKDIFWAYNPVGPNVDRVARFVEKYPDVQFKVTADHPGPIAALGEALASVSRTVEVLLDIDCGLARTGIPAGDQARKLYEQIAATKSLVPGGFHLYDGHNHQRDVSERRAAVLAGWEPARKLRDELVAAGLSVPRIVAGGTASFPIFAEIDDPAIELSPGTDHLSRLRLRRHVPRPEVHPRSAALNASHQPADSPTASRSTWATKPLPRKCPWPIAFVFPTCPTPCPCCRTRSTSSWRRPEANRYQPGDVLLAIPKHICPTCNLQQQVTVVSGGRVVDTWRVAARDRVLTV
jgi:D-threonine aldolase